MDWKMVIIPLGLLLGIGRADAQQSSDVAGRIQPGVYVEVIYVSYGEEAKAVGYVQSVKENVFTVLDTQLKTIQYADVISLQVRQFEKISRPSLKPEKVFTEFLAGGAIGFAGAMIAGGMADAPDGPGGAILAASVAYVLGSAAGVYWIGSSKDESGSFFMTILGGSAGLLVSGLAWHKTGVRGILVGAPLGAVIGFNATRRYKTVETTSLIEVGEGDVRLGTPDVQFGYDQRLQRSYYYTSLMTIRF